ncbi:MAG: hypothetical protein ACHQM6_06655 [Candidatus Kapaibacterium sp.]
MIAVIVSVQPLSAQPNAAKPFTIWIDAGGGYSRNISPGVPATASPGADYTNGGFTGLLRIRGSKNHFITIGLETGWQHIASASQQNAQASAFGTTNITATLSAIPVMGVISLQDYNIQAHASVGIYRLLSKATLFGNTVSSSEWDMAFSLAAGYEIDLPGDYRILPEFRWSRINDQQKSFLSLMIRVELPEWEPF